MYRGIPRSILRRSGDARPGYNGGNVSGRGGDADARRERGSGVLRVRGCAEGDPPLRGVDPQLGACRPEPRCPGGPDREDDPAAFRGNGDRGRDLRGSPGGHEEGPRAGIREARPAGGAGRRGRAPGGVPIYIDRSLRRFDTIYPAAGETNNMFVTTPDELLALTRGTEADLARDEPLPGDIP